MRNGSEKGYLPIVTYIEECATGFGLLMRGCSGGNRFGRLLKSLNPYQCVRENLRDYGLPYRTILRNDAHRREAILKTY